MAIYDDAHVTVLLGDYVAVDQTGKINALGVGFQFSPLQANGNTAGMCVAAVIDVPQKYAGEQYSVSLELRNMDINQVVALPGTTPPQALRFQQLVTATKPAINGVAIPDSVPCRHQIAAQLLEGIPLPPGRYGWRLEVDGQHRKNWHAYFNVLHPPAQPVVGGPVGGNPTDLPSL